MAEYTPYLNLKKPAPNEFYNVEDFNDNADLIDAEMEQQADGIGALQQTVNAHLAEKAPHANIPIAKITSSVDQSIPTGAGSWTTLFFDTKVFDTDNMYDSDYTDRLTCRTAGRYLIIAKAIFSNNETGHRSFQILKNGSASPPIVRGDYFPPNYCGMSISTLEVLEEGDYISVHAIQTSGNALNIGNSSLMMIRM
jgi:hypothetical protein